jgi:hypothetical protein
MSRYFPKQNDKTGWKRGLGAYSGGPIEHAEDPVYVQLLTGTKPKVNAGKTLRGFDGPKDKATKWSAGK